TFPLRGYLGPCWVIRRRSRIEVEVERPECPHAEDLLRQRHNAGTSSRAPRRTAAGLELQENQQRGGLAVRLTTFESCQRVYQPSLTCALSTRSHARDPAQLIVSIDQEIAV